VRPQVDGAREVELTAEVHAQDVDAAAQVQASLQLEAVHAGMSAAVDARLAVSAGAALLSAARPVARPVHHRALGGNEGAENLGEELHAFARADPGVRRRGIDVLAILSAGVAAGSLAIHVDAAVVEDVAAAIRMALRRLRR